MLKRVKKLFTLVGVALVGVMPMAQAKDCAPLLDHEFPRLQDGRPMSLCQFSGQVILVVNTASFCGYTNQYEGLEALYARLKDRGLVVLGFPSNDFGEQEPGSNGEIADFCRMTYGVQFPMVGKTVVKGAQTNPFYKQLARQTGSAPGWNFHKYLINRDATKVEAFDSRTRPDDPVLLEKLEQFLKP